MQTTNELLKARFNFCRKYLEDTLSHFTEEDLSWRPRDGMKTVREQLLEIVDKERETLMWIQTGKWPDEDPPTFDAESASFSEIKAAMQSLRTATFAYIDSLSEDGLNALFSNPNGWYEGLNLPEWPLHEALRTIAAHEWYHSAQLITYLGMRGEDLGN